MLILAIDTSTRAGSVAVLRNRQLLAVVSSVEPMPYENRLFQDISLLQTIAPFTMDQIDVFAVVVGPGSFTGLRVGLAAVKAWAEVHQKPVAAISGLEAVASQAKAQASRLDAYPTIVAPFMDARRGQIFGAIYRRTNVTGTKLALVGNETTLSVDEFLELVKLNSTESAPVLISTTPELLPPDRIHSILSAELPGLHAGLRAGVQAGIQLGLQVERASAVLAPVIGQLGFDRADRGELVDSLLLDASYVRRSDAEASWKDA